MRYEVYMDSDLYEVGKQCDGHPFIAERYFAQLEDANGRRWRHRFAVNGAEDLGCDEEGYSHFADRRAEAQDKVGKLVARVEAHLAAGGSINFDHWYEVRPAYGSDEHIAQGIDYQDWLIERNDARGHRC